MDRQLLRSRTNRVIVGVCGGIAEYFKMDPTLVRIIWAAISLVYGTGVIAYIIAAIIMPENKGGSYEPYRTENGGNLHQDSFDTGSDDWKADDEWKQQSGVDPNRSRNIVGIILIILGVLFLGRQLFSWLDMKVILPLAFIVIGGLIIFRGGRSSV